MTAEESKNQLFETLLKDALKHLSETLDKAIVLQKQLDIAVGALEDFELGHEHAPNLKHTRAMGDTYGWCDYCSQRVSWGPGFAEEALAQIEELGKK